MFYDERQHLLHAQPRPTRESLKYDGDYYWEYTNAYVNGVKQSVYVDQDLGAPGGRPSVQGHQDRG